jgi:hypothetical protein
VHVDENLAEATIGIISCSEVDLLTADARLLGVAVAPVGEAFALRKPGDRGGGRPLPVPSLIFMESGSWGSKDAPFLSFSAAQSSMAISWSIFMVVSLSGLEPRLDGRSRPNGPRGFLKGELRSRTALERCKQRMRVGHRDGWSASPGLLAAVVHGRKEGRTAFASAPPALIQPLRRKRPAM